MAKKFSQAAPKKPTFGAPLPLTSTPTEAEAAVWPAEEIPFVREIHAHPHDDNPRLVFADWLEERGDLRAEFIRVQCQLASLRFRDPQYAALEARANLLIDKHRAAWLKPYPKLPATTWGIHGAITWNFEGRGGMHHFSRGFNAAIHPKSFAALMRRASLMVDELGAIEIDYAPASRREAQGMAKLTQLARLDALLMIGEPCVEPVLTSPTLGSLARLSLSELEGGVARALRQYLDGPNSQRLRWLTLRGVDRVKELELVLGWKNLEQLDTFSIDGAPGGKALEAIAASTMRPSRLAFSTDDYTAEQVLARCAKLFRSPALSEVVALRIEGIPDKMAPVLGDFPLPPKTTTLYLTGMIRDAEAAAMARTDAFRQIKHLSIAGHPSGAFLSDKGAEALARAGGFDRLQSLDLSGSSIGDRGAEALVQSEALAGLIRLNLERTLVTRDSRGSLRKAFRGKLEV